MLVRRKTPMTKNKTYSKQPRVLDKLSSELKNFRLVIPSKDHARCSAILHQLQGKKEFWGSKDDTVIEFNKALKFSWIQTTANLNGSAFSIFIYLR